MHNETITLSAYVTLQELGEWLKLSRTTLYRMLKDGRLPPPLRIERALRWRVSTVKNWLDQQEQTTQGGN
ncbi:helix-turn-helix transcriptional regulator [Lonepinella sp. BR2357]|uniref:helix-turn-helix transcriptional regulator n=1 Tax=Lonepinella sp. BR2357 TaxID=3434549 RepID=UPI003F6E1995